MFEKHESLLERVELVSKRFRAVRFWWWLSGIASVATIGGVMLRHFVRSGAIPANQATMILLVCFAAFALAALIAVRMSYSNSRDTAQRIESKFPSLQQRLLTALSQSSTAGEPLGYLQNRVISDAYTHSVNHRWSETVPKASAWLSRITGLTALAALVTITTLLVRSLPEDLPGARSSLVPLRGVVVEPGNAEVEKGSGLVISARFAALRDLPSELRLQISSDASTADILTSPSSMTQSLDDPIYSHYVSTINESFHYVLESADWQSEPYSITVFEFPNMVRADAVLKFPDYTKLEPKRVEDTVRVTAVQGTSLEWTLHLNKAVESANLRTADGALCDLKPVSGQVNQLRFATTLGKTEKWTLELVDDRGRKNKYPITLDVRAIPNQPVDLKMVRGGDRVATPLEELGLAATAKDDFGTVRAGLTYSFADGANEDVVLAESIDRNLKHPLDYVVEMERLGVEPDQLLAYHFWAEDYSADGDIRRTQSDLYFIEIRPFDEIFREGEAPPGGESPPQQQQRSQETEELAELQKQIISATWKVSRDPRSVEEMRSFDDDVTLLQESQSDALEKAAELAEKANDDRSKEIVEGLTKSMQLAIENLRQAGAQRMKKPLDPALTAEQSAYQALLRLRAHEFEVSRSQRQQSQSSGSASQRQRQQQLDALELKNDENRYETQSQASDSEAQSEAARQDRQILDRLRELAQRQEDINKQVAQLQSALEAAVTEEEKEEVRRQLKRLRDQEQELLRDSDELADQMQQSPNRDAMSEQAEQLEQSRENVRRASEALQQDDAAEALAGGTRAERQLDELSEEFRKRAAGEFDETMQNLRAEARQLEETQQQIGEQLEEMTSEPGVGLRQGGDREAITEAMTKQRETLERLMEQIQSTVEQAEPSEPLLAQELYETFRTTQQSQLDRKLNDASELLRRGLDPQAQQLQQSAAADTKNLRESIEKAAESVLGNEQRALERALTQLEQLDRSLQNELREGQSQQPGQSQPQGEGQQPGEGQPQGAKPPSSPAGQGQELGSHGEGEPDQPLSDQPGQANPTPGGTNRVAGGGGPVSPITGGGFREFSDGLRDVEEMVGDPALRSEAAAIRDRAREMRQELRRHSEQPQWELVESMIAKPLRELKMRVSEELMKKSSERSATVPIDRDPVPDQFSGAVKRYYESLGSGR